MTVDSRQSRCEDTTRLVQCRGCLLVRYCSAQCQKEDWSTHKLICRKDELQLPTKTELKVQYCCELEENSPDQCARVDEFVRQYTSEELALLND
ncbi:hypothetical protein M427DRAFT_111802 [Gonapodya prolifera JEL478]|uniref:MYND-type domain-containing protein n=1 Tax=Gonapodya prolifera (strain JEL478) TaxID=1344416 RepID=A0A139AG94_GONPJ|nr:hypothetical protein M427DRAFT_111802 [Gonapodya prolifera JEL478]|eukprot:KXS15778.1 hypothetical protein M427DRAFT_111802 [Gonapodya prolifera JEL478]